LISSVTAEKKPIPGVLLVVQKSKPNSDYTISHIKPLKPVTKAPY